MPAQMPFLAPRLNSWLVRCHLASPSVPRANGGPSYGREHQPPATFPALTHLDPRYSIQVFEASLDRRPNTARTTIWETKQINLSEDIDTLNPLTQSYLNSRLSDISLRADGAGQSVQGRWSADRRCWAF